MDNSHFHENIEIERRWLVKALDKELIMAWAHAEIEQGYIETQDNLRVRITTYKHDGRYMYCDCEMTKKSGKGVKRLEQTVDISEPAARMLLEATPYSIKKTRYTHDGWEIDFFHGPLEGLILVERELESPDEDVKIPAWMHEYVEVTDTLSNKQLAITSHLLQGGELNIKELCTHIKAIVLTGAPGAGKSTIIRELSDNKKLLCVPEVASLVMSQVGIMPNIGEAHFNTMLYNVQISIEEAIKKQAVKLNKDAVIFDRGVLDSAAFMKNGAEAFNVLCKTTTERNCARYDAVIQLSIPPEDIYNKIKDNNPVRTETFEQAQELELKLYKVWSAHPNFRMLYDDGVTSWSIKSARIKELLNEFILQ